jgi:hypothetical protein
MMKFMSAEEVMRAWVEEAKRRREDIRAGREATVPAAEVLQQGRELIEQAKRQQSVG